MPATDPSKPAAPSEPAAIEIHDSLRARLSVSQRVSINDLAGLDTGCLVVSVHVRYERGNFIVAGCDTSGDTVIRGYSLALAPAIRQYRNAAEQLKRMRF